MRSIGTDHINDLRAGIAELTKTLDRIGPQNHRWKTLWMVRQAARHQLADLQDDLSKFCAPWFEAQS